MKKSFIIYAALHEESKEGAVWIPPIDGINSEFIKITNPEAGRCIVCERRTLDKNYVKRYNDRPSTRIINNINECIIINEYYRNKLGNLSTKEKVELEIVETNRSIDEIRAYLGHPNPYMRMGIKLGIISLILGVLALLWACFPFLFSTSLTQIAITGKFAYP